MNITPFHKIPWRDVFVYLALMCGCVTIIMLGVRTLKTDPPPAVITATDPTAKPFWLSLKNLYQSFQEWDFQEWDMKMAADEDAREEYLRTYYEAKLQEARARNEAELQSK